MENFGTRDKGNARATRGSFNSLHETHKYITRVCSRTHARVCTREREFEKFILFFFFTFFHCKLGELKDVNGARRGMYIYADFFFPPTVSSSDGFTREKRRHSKQITRDQRPRIYYAFYAGIPQRLINRRRFRNTRVSPLSPVYIEKRAFSAVY